MIRPHLVQLGCALSLLAAFPAFGQGALPDGEGKAPFEKVCGSCHGLDKATSLKKSEAEWKATVEDMMTFGAAGTDREFAAIVTYLAKNFGGPAAVSTAPQKTLPDGTGKDLIGKLCAGCHKPDSFTAYQHTPEEWAAILVRMGERVRVPSTKADLDEIAGYLAKNFPKVDDPTKVNVNKAPAADLAKLGFTPDEAQKIVEFRQTHPPFANWGDLLIIYGVDGKKVKAAKEHIGF